MAQLTAFQAGLPRLTAEGIGVISFSAEARETAALGCVNQLGEIQRRVVTLRMLEELTPADTASSLGLTSGHVSVLLHRAKLELIECLDRMK